MRCNSIFTKGALLIAVPALLLTACSKSSSTSLTNADDNGGYASDASRIELISNDVISIADVAGEYYNGSNLRTTHTTLGTSATVATDTLSATHTLIVRFDSTASLDGKIRSGAIIISYNGEYTDSGQVHTITFDHYTVNNNALSGTLKTIRIDTTVTGDWYYKVSVDETLNMNEDPLQSQLITWQGGLVRKWVKGFATPSDRSDDAFSISGSATLTRANLHQFTFDISTPIQFALNCDFAESGVINVSGPTLPVRVLNYGTGSCDPSAQVSIGATVYGITLTR